MSKQISEEKLREIIKKKVKKALTDEARKVCDREFITKGMRIK